MKHQSKQPKLTSFLSLLFVAAAISIIGLLAAVHPAEAEKTPEQVVSELMEKIKEQGSPAPFIEYVNWETAYADAPENMKAQMKISSAEEMKAAFVKMFTDTKGFFKEQFAERLKSVPEEQRPQYEANLEKMTAAIDQQQAKMKEQIQKTEYEVGKTTVDGDKATVMLTQSLDGQSREREIQLSKVGDNWLLDSASIFSGQGQQAAPQSAPPAPQGQAAPGAAAPQ